jgi:hypothetical protein
MPSTRSMLTCAGGLLGTLLIAGSVLACKHCGAADEHPAAVPAINSAVVPVVAPIIAPVAAPAPAASKLATKSTTPPAKKILNGPSWQALSTPQQLALVPLAGEWDAMDTQRKEKWIAIANKYGRMNPAEQNRIQTRMRDWIKLTPAERRSVRQSYASTKKWDADQKSAQWQQYLQLSDEQKEQLARQKLSQAPATAVSRVKPKAGPLVPMLPGNATVPTTAAAVPAGAVMPTSPPANK